MTAPMAPESERPRILLASPNVSRMMGGEALKALSIFEGYRAMGFDVTQVTHERVRPELTRYGICDDIVYVPESRVQYYSFRLKLTWLLRVVESWRLHREVQKQVDARRPWLIHFTGPITPTGVNFPISGAPVVIGPLNGNLLHPPALLFRESPGKRMGALLLRPAQLLSRVLFRGRLSARLFVSGGERTARALEMGGCKREQMAVTINSGIDPRLRDHARITHTGTNWRFAFLGRLVRYKACDLVIRALKLVPEATLEIIGGGPEEDALRALAEREGVAARVEFHPYNNDRMALFEHLRKFRAFVFPTLAEASGTVIQEAMMLGLPVVCADWGGPQLLVDPMVGIMIPPDSEDAIVQGLAEAMETLARNPALAEAFSVRARAKAEDVGYDWPSVLRTWVGLYDEWLEENGSPGRFGPFVAKNPVEIVTPSMVTEPG